LGTIIIYIVDVDVCPVACSDIDHASFDTPDA
jgi:hypothetical protein